MTSLVRIGYMCVGMGIYQVLDALRDRPPNLLAGIVVSVIGLILIVTGHYRHQGP